MKFTVRLIARKEQAGFGIWIEELPLFSEGETREEAIEGLVDTALRFCESYTDKPDFRCVIGTWQDELVKVLIDCKEDRGKIRQIISNSCWIYY